MFDFKLMPPLLLSVVVAFLPAKVAAQDSSAAASDVAPIAEPIAPIGLMPSDNPCNYVSVAPGYMCVPSLFGGFTIVPLQGFAVPSPSPAAPALPTDGPLAFPAVRFHSAQQPFLELRPKNACDDVTDVEEGYGCALRPDGSALIVPMNPSVPWKAEP